MKLFRRFALLAVAGGAFVGALAVPLATPVRADTTDVYSPAPTGLARLCVTVRAQKLCIHV